MSEREIVTLGQIRRELVRAVRRLLSVDERAARGLVVDAVLSWPGEADADDHIRAWLEENVELGGHGTATSTELYDDYVRWCADRGIRPVTSRRFVPALVGLGLERRKSGTKSEFLGVRLKYVPGEARFTVPVRLSPEMARVFGISAVTNGSRAADDAGGTPGQDPLARFIGEMVVRAADPRARCRSSDLYAAWCEWCARNGEDPGSNKRFSMALEARGFRKEHTSAGNVFVGIRLATGSGTTDGGNVG